MLLEGSCHCGAVRFSLESATPVPYMHCYCSICRKTAGGGGSAVNLGGDAASLTLEGEANVSVYQARIEGEREPSPARRHFCRLCGSALWVFDPRWPELIHPFASAIDTPLPPAPARVHIMLDWKPAWVALPEGPDQAHHDAYPEDSIAAWHAAHGLISS